MAEAKMPRSGSPAASAAALDQPRGAMPLTEMGKQDEKVVKDETVQLGSGGGPSTQSAADQHTAADAASRSQILAIAAEGGSKGKEKVSDTEDGLSIESESPAAPSTSNPDAPVCHITLLLPTGARHPHRLDEKYLEKRNVDVPEVTETGKKDPLSISIYKLKELILREWRDEWEDKPASPSSIRLIHFGKLLDDKEQLRKYHFSAGSANVVHMSVRPAEIVEEDDGGKGKSSGREGRGRDGGSGCCVVL